MAASKAEVEGAPLVVQRQEADGATKPFTPIPFSQPLPAEIIDIVIEFLLLKEEAPHAWIIEAKHPSLRTNIIRLVCRAWNQRVLSNPFLWTRFFFKLNADKPDWLRAQIEVGELQMSRCGDHGLHLRIGGGGRPLKESADSVQMFISFIRRSSDRWASINITGSAFTWLFSSLLVGPGGARTRWCTLRASNVSRCPLTPPRHRVCYMPATHFPSLQDIYLYEAGYSILSWDLPWSQLRHLSFVRDRANLSESIHVFGQCVNLESLALNARHCDGDTNPPHSSVVLPSLRSFKVNLEDCDQTLLTNILPYLVFPRLQSLELHESWPSFETPPDWTALYSLLQIIENSKCDVQDLQVYLSEGGGIVYWEPALNDLLQRTQKTLRKLLVDGVGLTGSFLQDFQPDCLEDFVVMEWQLEAENELTRGLVRWLRNQKRREGAMERLQKMERTFYCDDNDLVASGRWKVLEEEQREEQEGRDSH